MLSRLQRSRGEANLTLSKGDPWVRGRQRLAIGEMREGINGYFEAETVTHTYRKMHGISTTIMAKPPGDADIFDAVPDSNAETFFRSPGSKLGECFQPPVFDMA